MKFIKKALSVILVVVMVLSITTSAMAYEAPQEYLEDNTLFNIAYIQTFRNLRINRTKRALEAKANVIFKYLKSINVEMTKDDIYIKIMELDKNEEYPKIPNDLNIRIYKNLDEILAWREKIDKKETANVVYQYPEMPNGCEITSATILLNWMGYNVDKMTMHNTYLPRMAIKNGVMPNPEEYYIGDARGNNGWYCFENPIITACNNYLQDVGSNQRVKQVSGLSQEELDKYLSWNIPLVIWMTIDYKTPRYSSKSYVLPSGEKYNPYVNLHCVVVASKNNDGSYNIADPIVGWKTLSEKTFWSVFTAMGSRAVTVDCDGLVL